MAQGLLPEMGWKADTGSRILPLMAEGAGWSSRTETLSSW